jgi:AcrR family transcriptional regulator
MPNTNSPSGSGRKERKPRRDATLERLLDGAQATFAERGYHAANIHEICSRADVGIGTFYAHFDHKRELLQQVVVERGVVLSGLLTPDDLLDRKRLASALRRAVDDPASAGLWRAWHEAVLEEPDIARFHAGWRAESLKALIDIVVEARRRSPSKRRRIDAATVSWTMMTLTRDLAIQDRRGAPELGELAELFDELVLGTRKAD